MPRPPRRTSRSEGARALFHRVACLTPAVAFALAAGVAWAQSAPNSLAQPLPIVGTIPEPRDVPYPGTIRLDVDASQTGQGIFTVHEVIPVQPGPLTLLYPKWLPGNHAPSGEVDKLAGLVVRADGRVLPWTRDTVDLFAFHVDAPPGTSELTADFQYLSRLGDAPGL